MKAEGLTSDAMVYERALADCPAGVPLLSRMCPDSVAFLRRRCRGYAATGNDALIALSTASG